MPRTKNVIEYQAFEYDHKDQSPDWFWAVGIITIALSVTAIILHDVLFAFVLILSGFVLSLYAARPPKEIDIVFNEDGVRIDKTFYGFYSLESFWIDETGPSHKVLIKSQRLIMPYIIVPLGDADADDIHAHLSRHLPEVFHSESIFQKFMEYLGF